MRLYNQQNLIDLAKNEDGTKNQDGILQLEDKLAFERSAFPVYRTEEEQQKNIEMLTFAISGVHTPNKEALELIEMVKPDVSDMEGLH